MVTTEERLRARYRAYGWTPVQEGFSGATTYRLDRLDRPDRPGLYVKTAPLSDHPDARSGLRQEAERIAWLADREIPSPDLVESGEHDGVSWLVMTALPGRSAAEPWPAARRDAVIDAVADLLRDLHALPVDGCPFDRRLDVMLGSARWALEHEVTDVRAAEVEEWKRELDLAGLLAELEASRPAYEDVVLGHGDYCLPNLLLDPETLEPTGLIDLGRLGRTDRHADLALMSGSIASDSLNPQYRPGHVERFLARYGVDPDDPRLTYFRRLDLLF